jgi:hypothetical protein
MKTTKKAKTKTITQCARQGDVLLLRRDEALPINAVELPRDEGRIVLAYGEVTGHAHAIRDQGVCLLHAEGVAFDLLRVSDGILAKLVHEEHATITVGPGLYERRVQREYAWSAEAEATSRAVRD